MRALPAGLDTGVGSGGLALSAAQAQQVRAGGSYAALWRSWHGDDATAGTPVT